MGDSNWSATPFYNYYPPHDGRSGSIPGVGDHRGQLPEGDDAHFNHRRSLTQPGSFLPPPPPHTASISNSNHLNLPPFSSTFQPPAFHSNTRQDTTTTTTTTQGGIPPASPGIHMSPHSGVFAHVPFGPPGSYHYPMSSPATMAALPPVSRGPPGFSPRVPGYPTSPGLHAMSPQQSPSTQLGSNHVPSSSNSSSSYPPSVPPPHTVTSLPSLTGRAAGKQRQRDSTGTTDQSDEWEDATVVNDHSIGGMDPHANNGASASSSSIKGRGDNTDQPWGMPQEEYKALNSKDKKQVRNRVGAKRFRAKRKQHVHNLEIMKRTQLEEIHDLRTRLKAIAVENNELRLRLNEPPMPLPVFQADDGSEGEGLGLNVGAGESWSDDLGAQQPDGPGSTGTPVHPLPGSHGFGPRMNHDGGVGLGLGGSMAN